MAESLDYVPMPDSVVTLIEASWKKEIRGPGGQPVRLTPGAARRERPVA